jgi:hypothetical protein
MAEPLFDQEGRLWIGNGLTVGGVLIGPQTSAEVPDASDAGGPTVEDSLTALQNANIQLAVDITGINDLVLQVIADVENIDGIFGGLCT